MFTRVKHYLDGRLFEWTFSLGSVWLAVAVLVWPEIVQMGAFRHIMDFFSTDGLVATSLSIGFIGGVALATNGVSLVIGPMVRAACAVGRAFLWGQVAYALWLYGNAQSVPSLGLGFWVLFTCAELYVAYRAMMDAAVARSLSL